LALPNGAAAPYVEVIERARPQTVIVDLGADYRFDGDWAYGQPERFAHFIKGAKRIANPGCYATGAQLALAPIVEELAGRPAVFGVSGYSGAGKKPSPKNDPEVLRDNLLPYSLVDHIHEREVSAHLDQPVRFLPHVAPFFRGITLTIAAELDTGSSVSGLFSRYRVFYESSPLVSVRTEVPEVREVRGTHGVIIGGFAVSADDPRQVSMVCVLDNLLKGAATQAVQNLNLAFGYPPLAGIERPTGAKA
jgi:N-acetyl-gamma-glutamyl-phosphate reductase common form